MTFHWNKYTFFAGLGIVLLGALAWRYPSKPVVGPEIASAVVTAAAQKPVGVELAVVQRVTLQDDVQSVGTLRSHQSVMLRPEVAGRVQALGFSDGARVRKGQVLVQLDDTLQRAEVKQAQAQVSIAQANHQRNRELVAQNFVAQRVLDESAAALQVAQAQQTLADARLSRMAITAPFAAQVGMRAVNVGDYVKDGADLLNLEDPSTMLVDFRLPERYAQQIKTGQLVELVLDAFAGRIFKARVQAIDPLLDANGRSVHVRAVLPNTPGVPIDQAALASRVQRVSHAPESAPLRAGMFARIRAIFGVNTAALVVPEEAIVPQGGKQFVIKAVPLAASGAPTVAGGAPAQPSSAPDVAWVSMRQEVKLGVRQAGKVQVLEGLNENQAVVVAGQQRLQRDGTPLSKLESAGGAASAVPSAASKS